MESYVEDGELVGFVDEGVELAGVGAVEFLAVGLEDF